MSSSDPTSLDSTFLSRTFFLIACTAFTLVAISSIRQNSPRILSTESPPPSTTKDSSTRRASETKKRRAVDSLYIPEDKNGIDLRDKISEVSAVCICLTRELNDISLGGGEGEGDDGRVREEVLGVMRLLCDIQQVLAKGEERGEGWEACLKATVGVIEGVLGTVRQEVGEVGLKRGLGERLGRQLQGQRFVLEMLLEQAEHSGGEKEESATGGGYSEMDPLQSPEFTDEHMGITPGLDEKCWIYPPPYSPPGTSSESNSTAWISEEKAGSPKQESRPFDADAVINAVYANDSDALLDLLSNEADAAVAFGELRRTPLHVAAHLNYCKCLAALLKHGAVMATEDAKGDTALHLAAWAGNVEALSVLLSYGSEVDSLSGRDGYSPLWCSVSAHQIDAARILLKNGASVSLQAASGGGLTPLHQAAATGQSAMCEVLLDRGALIDARDDDKNTPLHYAATSGSLASVKTLLRNGASVELQQNFGLTAIHWAAHTGHADIVGLLADHGSDVDAVAGDGATPLHLAANRGHTGAARLLLERGANRRPKATWDGTSGTPAEMAKAKGHHRVVRLLRA